ncbi:hypothetical protein HOLDEFILI_02236 [Holdemania filiformis DSM 12042]|uniref:Uncharacterized protein n=1 Tax=Holdemania filiformis DSM 12042 TaxID=545696 RepID=B9Y8T6_9FIRM|nr:hypothetical protein HOLDEFILI_02236 [Holdemania filiformis DSM 12042]
MGDKPWRFFSKGDRRAWRISRFSIRACFFFAVNQLEACYAS